MIDLTTFTRFSAALLFVIGLIALAAWIAKRVMGVNAASSGRGKRLAVIETLPLDAKQRLMLVRRDQTEHLVCVGPNGVSVLESGVPARPEALQS
jgi:flagellar protein FliO/FliZ